MKRMDVRAAFAARNRTADLVAKSDAMRSVLALTERAARSGATVLVWGESGTGKERIARLVHDQSRRADGPFVAVNCKALSPGVLESELFGHAKGAFTGASGDRRGLFEQADGGTILLDEIGEVGEDVQGKLLRVLQEREVRPVGASRSVPVDVRVVAATNRNLRDEVDAGRFRQDLFFRLAVIPIHVPPLRERGAGELLAMARHFLDKSSHAMGRDVRGWSADVERWWLAHRWPGNVRELENMTERAVALASGDTITLDDLLLDAMGPTEGPTSGRTKTLEEVLDEAAARHVRAVLASTRGRRIEAAKLLGVERTTLYRLIKKHGIEQ